MRRRARAVSWMATLVAGLLIVVVPARSQGLGSDLPELPPTPRHLRERAEPLSPALVMAGTVNPDRYRVGPGDVFVLEFSGRLVRTVVAEVGPEGVILLPEAGGVRVAGATLAEARARMLERLRREFRDLRIEVVLQRPRSFRVQLTGAVKSPGPITATGSARVGDVVAADMLLPEASRRRIEVRHTDGSAELADLDRLLRLGDHSRDPELRDGDVLHVPPATEFVWATGAFASPGRFERAPDDSLHTLLRLAGGALPSASPTAALWLSWKDGAADSVRVSLADLQNGQGGQPLRDGDRLYLYFVPGYLEQHQAVILGEVQQPGGYPIHEGRTRLSDIVGAAGGLLPGADPSSVRIRRLRARSDEKDPELERLLRLSRNELTASEYEVLRTKLAEMREDYRVDWLALQKGGEALDVLVRDADLIRVDRLVSMVRVDGEVRRPAILTYRAGLSVEDYVAQAGGLTNRAWRGKIRVTRAVTGQTLLAKDVRQLDPGDFLWVPEKPDVTIWQQTRDVLSALAQVATIVIAIRSLR